MGRHSLSICNATRKKTFASVQPVLVTEDRNKLESPITFFSQSAISTAIYMTLSIREKSVIILLITFSSETKRMINFFTSSLA